MTTLGINVGDEFIREGICSFLDEIFPAWRPFYVNKHDLSTLCRRVGDEQESLADKFADADLVIQAGAPVYWKIGDSTSYNVEWAEELWYKRIFRLGPEKPILNIAAGACQPYPDFAKTFLADPQCVDFARKAAAACAWTSVRDPLASQILYGLDIQHEVLPCSAFHAARRLQYDQQSDNVIGVNLMSCGGHFKLRDDVNNDSWEAAVRIFLPQLRKRHKLLFIAHDQLEKTFMESFLQEGETIFLAADYRQYMQAYSRCAAVVVNRVHGGVCAAGFGRPAIIIGNDTRLQIGDYIGLASRYVGSVHGDEIVALVEEAVQNRKQEEERLLTLREESAVRYRQAICAALAIEHADNASLAPGKASGKMARKTISLGSVQELSSASFKDFMTTMNCFASRLGLRQITNQQKVWEYPWLWFNSLSTVNWQSMSVLDFGSEISPMPWYLASLGARVTLLEADPQWVPIWERLKAQTGLNVDWRLVDGDSLPFADKSFDAVTSFSVIEHQGDKPKAIEEVARVLKPGGLFALSFDICEAEMGMTFPEWNGRALTMAEFNRIIWSNPEFNRGKTPAVLNVEDLPSFVQWHLESAPHHNYAVGAATLRKKLIDEKSLHKILVPRFDTFGDIVLLEGFLERLQEIYPDAEITMLVRKDYGQLAPLFPPTLRLRWLTVDLPAFIAPSESDHVVLRSCLEKLLAERYDVVMFTAFSHTWLDNALAAGLLRVPKIAIATERGIEGWPSERLVTIPVKIEQHEVQKYQTVIDALTESVATILPPPRLSMPSELAKRAAEILELIGLIDQPFVACVPAGLQNQPIKAWPLERFAEVIAWLATEYRFVPLLLGHESEQRHVSSLAVMLASRGIKASTWLGKNGELPLLAALIQNSRLYLGNDSGPMHIAAAFDVPVVGIFGGGHMLRFLPCGDKSCGVVGDLPCFGCGWDCIFGDAPCVKLVSVDDVKSAARRILAGEHIPGNLVRAAHAVSAETLDFIEKALREARKRAGKFRLQLQQCQGQVAECTQPAANKDLEIEQLENAIAELKNSKSWRLTEPVRRILSLFKESQ